MNITEKQKKILLNYMKDNPDFARGRLRYNSRNKKILEEESNYSISNNNNLEFGIDEIDDIVLDDKYTNIPCQQVNHKRQKTHDNNMNNNLKFGIDEIDDIVLDDKYTNIIPCQQVNHKRQKTHDKGISNNLEFGIDEIDIVLDDKYTNVKVLDFSAINKNKENNSSVAVEMMRENIEIKKEKLKISQEKLVLQKEKFEYLKSIHSEYKHILSNVDHNIIRLTEEIEKIVPSYLT